MADMSRFAEFGGDLASKLLSGTIIVFFVLKMGGIILGIGLSDI